MLQYPSFHSLLLRVPKLPCPFFPPPSHRPQILQRVARSHVPTGTTPHYRVTGVGDGPPGPSSALHLLHATTYSHKRHRSHHAQPPHRQSHGRSPPGITQRAHQPRLHASPCHRRHHLQRPDRLVPHYLQPGQRIRRCLLGIQRQLHSLNPHQNMAKGRTPARLPRSLQVAVGAGLQTPPA
jgi:hypothetical protein